MDGLEGGLVGPIDHGLLEHYQDSLALVEDPVELLVEDHLRQFLLDLRDRQADPRRDVLDLDSAVRLDYPTQVLFQHAIVERAQVSLHHRVLLEFLPVSAETGLEIREGPILGSFRDRLHRFDVRTGVLEGELPPDDVLHVLRLVEHYLGEQHVLEGEGRLLRLGGVVPLEGLVEVGVGRLEVSLVGRVQDAGLQVEGGLDAGRAVDRVGRGPGRGERGPGLGQVGQGVVSLALEQLHLDEQVLVVELLELLEQGRPEGEGLPEHGRVVVERDQPGLEALAQEGALLGLGPLDALLAQLHAALDPALQVEEHLDEGPDHLGGLGLADGPEERPRPPDQVGQLPALFLGGVLVGELHDGLFLCPESVLV